MKMAYTPLKNFEQILDSFLSSAPLQMSWLREAAIEFVNHLFLTGFRYGMLRVAGDENQLFLIIDEALRVEILGSEIVVEHGFDGKGKLSFENVPFGCWSCPIARFVPTSYGK